VTSPRPDWNRLFETASSQAGLFTTGQAAEAGYSRPLLFHHVQTGRVHPLRRGIFRVTHSPSSEHEDLVEIWLWSGRAGVFSHQTALALHELSDVLPSKIHLTVPSAWRSRRLRVPKGVVLYHHDVSDAERTWFGPVPVTTPLRTLDDCARDGLSTDLLRQAAEQAERRGLVRKRDLRRVAKALESHGGRVA
jgi:predicted transcriptional regulator of viral defense system